MQVIADISKTRKTVLRDPILFSDLLSESLTGFVSLLVSLPVENVVISHKMVFCENEAV